MGVWRVSLAEFMNFKLLVKTILVVNIKFGLFLGHPLSQRAVEMNGPRTHGHVDSFVGTLFGVGF